MTKEPEKGSPAAVMFRINRAWQDGRVEDLASLVHDGIVMALPGFAGRIRGRDAFLDGFRDFCRNAKIREFQDHDHQIDLVGDTAVNVFLFEMLYERSGKPYRATGRDLWVFCRQGSEWVAVWRTMLEMTEREA